MLLWVAELTLNKIDAIMNRKEIEENMWKYLMREWVNHISLVPKIIVD
jgi:hypothetical protein